MRMARLCVYGPVYVHVHTYVHLASPNKQPSMILDEKLNFWSFSRSLEWVLNSKKKEGGGEPMFVGSSKKENGWHRKAGRGGGRRGGKGKGLARKHFKSILWKKAIARINETRSLLGNFLIWPFNWIASSPVIFTPAQCCTRVLYIGVGTHADRYKFFWNDCRYCWPKEENFQ